MPARARNAIVSGLGGAAVLTFAIAAQPSPAGVQDPAWSPDSKRLATSYLERIFISAPDGKNGRALRSDSTAVERDPAWSPDGKSIAFAADAGEGFDIYVANADGKNARTLTSGNGEARWPSWTRDGRIVYSLRESPLAPWELWSVNTEGGDAVPLFGDAGTDAEFDAEVSPDGKRIAYISDRESDDGDVDLWIADLPSEPKARAQRTRLTRVRGAERAPTWAPDSNRIAFFARRDGAGSVWVTSIDAPASAVGGAGRGGRGTGGPPASRPRPAMQPVLASRHGGAPAWSPDGRRLAIADFPPAEPAYNGNPLRSGDDPPPLFATDAFRLWLVDAPIPVDSGAGEVAIHDSAYRRRTLVGAFDRVWETLQRLYYSSGPSADAWRGLREKYRKEAESAQDEASLETVIDTLVAEQPLIKPAVTSSRAVVVSGHPLASEAGRLALERGGNIVDAAVAVSFALGVLEPEASGIGGDGMAVLYLKGMKEPIVVDYKDQAPIRATSDNQTLRQNSGDGPAAANIPGVVAGLDYLYRTYGSKKVSWEDLIAPAIEHADKGFVLDEALPTSINEGRRFFEKYPESKTIYLPGGKVPRPGERFVNKDYANTLRAIAKGGAQSFYRGDIARRIAADMAKNGGLITIDDLAQYRAIERRPLAGQYRDHVVFSAPPPVSTGLSLLETLQILQNYQPKPGASITTDADYLHYAIEAWKVRDQGARIADPGLFEVNLGQHLDPAHAATLFKRIDPKKASRGSGDGRGTGPGTGGGGLEDLVGHISTGTTAFAVADADGNMIAITQTLSTWGGTFYVSEGLGFLYNNHLRFGGGGAPGRFLPLARSSSTSVPTLVFRKSSDSNVPGVPRLATAAAGNAWITASVYDIILNVIDSGMPAQKAIEAPRFLIGRDPVDTDVSRMQIEDRFPRAILQDLMARGHRFQKIGRKGEVRYGYAAAIVVDPDKRDVQAGAEPRRSHGAAALR